MRNRIYVLLTSAFVAGLAQFGPSCIAAETQPPKAAVIPTPPEARSLARRDRTAFLEKYLKLDEEQTKKARVVMVNETKKLTELRAQKSIAPDERRKKFAEIRDDTSAQLKKILTEEQWKQYAQLTQRAMRQARQQVTPTTVPAEKAK